MNIVLDPVTKLIYLEAAWEEEYIETGKKHLKRTSKFPSILHMNIMFYISFSFLSLRPSMKLRKKIQRLYMTTLKILTYVSC